MEVNKIGFSTYHYSVTTQTQMNTLPKVSFAFPLEIWRAALAAKDL